VGLSTQFYRFDLLLGYSLGYGSSIIGVLYREEREISLVLDELIEKKERWVSDC
jgi:hypothetical protein